MQLKKTHVIKSPDGTVTRVKVYDTKEKMKYAVEASIDCCKSIIEVTDGMDSDMFLRNQTVMKSGGDGSADNRQFHERDAD